MHRGDIDDAPALLFEHARQGVFAHQEWPRQHHGQQGVPLAQREVLHGRDVQQHGSIHQHIHGAVLRQQLLMKGDDLRLAGDVQRIGAGVGQATRGLFGGRQIDVAQGHEITLGGEGPGNRQADALGGAGDHHGTLRRVHVQAPVDAGCRWQRLMTSRAAGFSIDVRSPASWPR
ncbi:hypothetical protein D3C76_1309300 [compost metagenome]